MENPKFLIDNNTLREITGMLCCFASESPYKPQAEDLKERIFKLQGDTNNNMSNTTN